MSCQQGEGEAQPSQEGAGVARILDRGPQAQDVLEREDRHRENLEAVECGPEWLPNGGNGLEYHHQDVCDDQDRQARTNEPFEPGVNLRGQQQPVDVPSGSAVARWG
jgi:hypothetical protein